MSASHSIQVYAAAGQNFVGDEARIVNWSAVASGKARATIATAASAQSMGIITGVEVDGAQQRLTVCAFGICNVRAGATFTPGTTELAFVADADGFAVPASAGQRVVGRLIPADGVVVTAGMTVLCAIYPHELET